MVTILLLFAAPLSVEGVYSPTWTAGDGWLSSCYRTTAVFGIPICLTQDAWNVGEAKRNHIANVLAQARARLAR